MTADADWVEEVRRWCLGTSRERVSVEGPRVAGESEPVGYEAAHPALEARYWPEDIASQGLAPD